MSMLVGAEEYMSPQRILPLEALNYLERLMALPRRRYANSLLRPTRLGHFAYIVLGQGCNPYIGCNASLFRHQNTALESAGSL